MTPTEIKTQIDANNEMIERLMDPTKFTLNTVISNLLQENSKLQEQCEHEFCDNKCIYCYKENK